MNSNKLPAKRFEVYPRNVSHNPHTKPVADAMRSLDPINLLLEIILKTHFFDSRCIFVFTEAIKKIDVRPEIPLVYQVVRNNMLGPHLIFHRFGCQDVIINHENSSELFVEFERLIRVNGDRFNARRYIVVGEDVTTLFGTEELEHVSDLLIIEPGDGGTYNLLTHFFERNAAKRRVVDVWFPHNCSFLHKNNLFPDKLRDQNGRQLKIGTLSYEPYSIIDNGTFRGTETSLVLEFIKKYNLTPSFTIITGDDPWGDIYENWTGTGILGTLANGSADIGYGAVYTWEEYYKYLDYSKPLTRTGITCIVPSPQLAAGWLTPFYSFSVKIWICLLMVLLSDSIILSFIFYQSKRKSYVQDSLLTVLKLYLLQNFTIQIKGKVFKYFIALNMLNVLLISTTYSSGLSTVMTVPRYEKAIRTVKDLALSGLPWGATTDAWLISLRHVEEEDYITVRKQFVVKAEEDLVASSRSHNFGFPLERLPYGHYAVGPYIKRDIISQYRIMREDIYWEQCIFLLRKNSVLLPLVDDLILRVFEAGLAAHWENQVVSRYMDMSVQRGIMYNTKQRHIVKLKWTHVEGAFGILIMGHAASAVTFLVELLSK